MPYPRPCDLLNHGEARHEGLLLGLGRVSSVSRTPVASPIAQIRSER